MPSMIKHSRATGTSLGAERRDIIGCPFDAVSFAEAVRIIRHAVENGRRLQVVPGNVDFVMKARRDPAFASELHAADLIVADGVPVTWAGRVLGQPLKGRVSGTELVLACAEISARSGRAVAMIGGRGDITRRAADVMEKLHPGSRMRALETPFPLTPESNRRLVDRIREIEAAIVLVALGAPRQERWVRENLAASGAHVGIGIGSAFDIISGDKPRAPKWMCDNGLEWLHRMAQEPRRLGRRYLVEDLPFVWHVAANALGRAMRRG